MTPKQSPTSKTSFSGKDQAGGNNEIDVGGDKINNTTTKSPSDKALLSVVTIHHQQPANNNTGGSSSRGFENSPNCVKAKFGMIVAMVQLLCAVLILNAANNVIQLDHPLSPMIFWLLWGSFPA